MYRNYNWINAGGVTGDMFKRKTTVVNKTGIHARPAANFVARAKQFQSNIMVTNLSEDKGDTVNAKSIIEILSLAMAEGSEVEISADGVDEEAAVNGLIVLINSGLGE